MSNAANGEGAMTGGAFEMALEVVVIPVSDVDRAQRFCAGLGWRLDLDFDSGDGYRVIQFTPPGCGLLDHLQGDGDDGGTGSTRALHLVVSDICKAYVELVRCGVDVCGPFRRLPPASSTESGSKAMSPARTPAQELRLYLSFVDPDGESMSRAGNHRPTGPGPDGVRYPLPRPKSSMPRCIPRIRTPGVRRAARVGMRKRRTVQGRRLGARSQPSTARPRQ